MIDTDHLCMPEFFNETRPKARAAHRCCECWRTIKPGDSYVRAVGKWDGYFDTFKISTRCDRLRNKILKKTGYAIGFGYLREAIREEIDNR